MGPARSKAKNAAAYGIYFLLFLIEGQSICFAFSPVSRNRESNSSGRESEYLVLSGVEGISGGTLVTSYRSEPKTLNPLAAIDGVSKEIIGLTNADLIHINRYTLQTEPALASSWTRSRDGRRFTVHLRQGLRFSDGYPFDADDVLFTFRAYLDEKVHSPQRDLLIVGGQPISVRKADEYTVIFDLAQPYGAAERLFDSIEILPRHLLEPLYERNMLANAWTLNTIPTQMAGLGPFRIVQYSPGERIFLEKNPFYWKKDSQGTRLPYLDRIAFLFSPTPETEEIRFQAGELDMISRFDPQDFSTLERSADHTFRLFDAGPGFEYSFLLFNLNDLGKQGHDLLAEKQRWFEQAAFRRAIASAIDRDAIDRLAYSGRAQPLSTPISSGNRLWFNNNIPKPVRSVANAREILRSADFTWRADGGLRDPSGKTVGFSIAYNAAKPQQERIAAIVQQDLKEIGISVNPVPMDFAALVDRIFSSFRYETAIMTLADGDADPNSEMNVWPSNGRAHIWQLDRKNQPEKWQVEIDHLMEEQMVTLDRARRKQLFDRVQQILWDEQPVVFLVSPDILAGANFRVGNFQPALLSSYTLWNADRLFLRGSSGTRKHP